MIKKTNNDAPLIIMITGLPGTGKTTLAKTLQSRISFPTEHLNTDIIRKKMFSPKDFISTSDYNKKVYSPQNRNLVYRVLFLIMETLLYYNISVIVDGTFYKQSFRKKIYNLAEKCGANLKVIYVTCDEEILKKRINERQCEDHSDSDADFGVYLKYKDLFEPLLVSHITISTVKNVNDIIMEVNNYINQ